MDRCDLRGDRAHLPFTVFFARKVCVRFAENAVVDIQHPVSLIVVHDGKDAEGRTALENKLESVAFRLERQALDRKDGICRAGLQDAGKHQQRAKTGSARTQDELFPLSTREQQKRARL